MIKYEISGKSRCVEQASGYDRKSQTQIPRSENRAYVHPIANERGSVNARAAKKTEPLLAK